MALRAFASISLLTDTTDDADVAGAPPLAELPPPTLLLLLVLLLLLLLLLLLQVEHSFRVDRI